MYTLDNEKKYFLSTMEVLKTANMSTKKKNK